MITAVQFQTGLFEEHLEECSFLLEQTLFVRDEPYGAYLDGLELEWRFQRHFQALRQGGAIARQCCLAKIGEGDWGELASALMVLESAGASESILSALESLDGNDQEVLLGLFSGWLQMAPAEGWASRWQALQQTNPQLVPALAKAGAWIRDRELTHMLMQHPYETDEAPLLTEARGRVRGHQPFALSEEPSVSVLESALRLGNPAALKRIRDGFSEEPGVLLALAGNEHDAELYHQLLETEHAEIGIWGLGLLGVPRFFPSLIEQLEKPPMARAAHHALLMISGLEMADLGDEELDMGPLVKIWHDWAERQKDTWRTVARVRAGQAWNVTTLMEAIRAGTHANWAQRWLAAELTIRCGLDVPVEWEYWSHRRQQSLEQWRVNDEPAHAGTPFPFAGRPQPR